MSDDRDMLQFWRDLLNAPLQFQPRLLKKLGGYETR